VHGRKDNSYYDGDEEGIIVPYGREGRMEGRKLFTQVDASYRGSTPPIINQTRLGSGEARLVLGLGLGLYCVVVRARTPPYTTSAESAAATLEPL